VRACFMLPMVRTPSSPVRERERETVRVRERERERESEKERKREREREKDGKKERCRIWLLNLFHCF
jgi:hypothetical protein